MIFFAVASPTPGSVSTISSAVALLRSSGAASVFSLALALALSLALVFALLSGAVTWPLDVMSAPRRTRLMRDENATSLTRDLGNISRLPIGDFRRLTGFTLHVGSVR